MSKKKESTNYIHLFEGGWITEEAAKRIATFEGTLDEYFLFMSGVGENKIKWEEPPVHTEIKPCSCGGTPTVEYHMQYGHGDSGYDGLRLECSCGKALMADNKMQEKYGYGSPGFDAIENLILKWNKQ